MMDSIWERFFTIVAIAIVSATALFMLFTMFWLAPINLLAQRHCLQAGYPKTLTDYTGTSYCVTLDGAVKVNVKELP